ncbi:MAG: transporter substrate-binding domain-containing protein [Oscillospiraceae bacterium]|nr:transporter substrate-binding domain-containing protein [Oscillospiraceae bacterium]
MCYNTLYYRWNQSIICLNQERKLVIMKKKIAVGFSALAMSMLLLTGCGSNLKNNVHSIEDLKGKVIGVQLGTTGDTLAGDIEDATVEKYNKAADGVQALKQGKIDAVIVDLETAKAFTEMNADIEILGEEFADEEYAIALNLENTALQQELNDALKALTDNGTLQEIKDNYEGDEKGQHPYVPREDLDRPKGKLVMATNAEFPPYEERQGSEIVGFDVDMMNAVCDYLGYDLLIEDMAFDSIIPAVQSGKADVGVAGLSVTPEREKNVLFTENYAVTHQVVIVRK